jgi:hypothetical protein
MIVDEVTLVVSPPVDEPYRVFDALSRCERALSYQILNSEPRASETKP